MVAIKRKLETQEFFRQYYVIRGGQVPAMLGDLFVVTGMDKRGKRFKLTNSSLQHCLCVNVWQGNVWLQRVDGKRFLLRRIVN